MSTTTHACDCPSCPNGAPYQWKVSLSGITNNACTDCGHINGDYILSWSSSTPTTCNWAAAIGGWCTYLTMLLTVSKNSDGTVTIQVQFQSPNPAVEHPVGAAPNVA